VSSEEIARPAASAADEPGEATIDTLPATSETAEEQAGSRIAGVASTIAGAAGPVISAALTPVRSLASGANRVIGERPGARVRQVREMARHDLANLWELHPEARRASIRELGLVSVPVDRIKGTAVEGAPQRGGDFLPLKARRSDDWRARWQRILGALDRLESLPPVELIKFDDGYWVVDGHNRVAAALYNGQGELDAVVEELRVPGTPSDRSGPAPSIAAVLDGSLDLRAAGTGLLTRTATRPDDLDGVRRARELEAEFAPAETPDEASESGAPD
jgi:hypothetical protein